MQPDQSLYLSEAFKKSVSNSIQITKYEEHKLATQMAEKKRAIWVIFVSLPSSQKRISVIRKLTKQFPELKTQLSGNDQLLVEDRVTQIIKFDTNCLCFYALLSIIDSWKARSLAKKKITVLKRQYISNRNALIESNLKFALHIVKKKYRLFSQNMRQDLLQIAYEAMIRAADSFNPKFDCKFVTYAALWITTKSNRYINDDSTVSIISHKDNTINTLTKLSHEHSLKIDSLEDRNKLSKLSGISVYKIERALEASRASDTCELPDTDNLISSQTGTQETSMTLASARGLLQKIMNSRLTPREREIIEKCFGFKDDMSQSEIAKTMSFSRQRAKQIEKAAIGKLGLSLLSRYKMSDIL